MTIFPLRHSVVHIKTELTSTIDELGNDVWEETIVEKPVKVAGWAQPTGDEPKIAGHDRQTVDVELYAPAGTFHPDDQVQLPGHDKRFSVIGAAADFEHSPFRWTPGLEIVHLASTN